MTTTETILWGCVGGLLPDVLRLIGQRYQEPPYYLKRWFFWFSLMLLVVVAGVAVHLLAPTRIIDAVAIGFSAPEILSSALGARKPTISRAKKIEGRHRTTDGLTHFRTGRGAGEHDEWVSVGEWINERAAELRSWWAK